MNYERAFIATGIFLGYCAGNLWYEWVTGKRRWSQSFYECIAALTTTVISALLF